MAGTSGFYVPPRGQLDIPEMTADRPMTGESFNIAAQLPGMWHDVPNVGVDFPESGIYTVDVVMFSAIRAQTPAHFAITGRCVRSDNVEVANSKIMGAIFANYFDGASGADFDGDMEVAHQGGVSFTYVGPATEVRLQARFERLTPPASGPVDPISALIRNDGYGSTSMRAVMVPFRTE